MSEIDAAARTRPHTSSGQDRLEDSRAADRIVRDVEAKILSGHYADGATLPSERVLMLEYTSSRTVVREAITTLSSRGFLYNRPRFRPLIQKPGYESALKSVDNVVTHLMQDAAGVKSLYESRILIEAALARSAALNARRGDIEKLRDALVRNEAAIDDAELFYSTDVGFHGVLYEIPKNPIYAAVHKAYVSWLSSHWEMMKRSPDINRINYASHKLIFECIAERDPDAAEAALQTHLNSAWEYVRSTF